MRKQRSFKWLGRAPAVALTVLALASTCAAADAVKVTADGQIEYAGRFVGGKGADCDVGSLSWIVMHLGSGIDHEGRPEQMFKMPYHRGTRAPFLAAEMAAHAPAGPPPATSTSTS